MENSTFQRVKRLAWLAGVSLEKLCDEAGVATSTVYRWRADETSANERTIKKLSETSERLQKNNPFLDS